MTTFINPAHRVLGTFIQAGMKVFAIGFIKNDIECCMPYHATVNAVKTYKHEKLSNYDTIIINGEEITVDELNSELEELLQSQLPINIITRKKLPISDWRKTLDENKYHVNTKLEIVNNYTIVQLSAKGEPPQDLKEVLIIGGHNQKRFETRAGELLLLPLLPHNTNVTFGTFGPWEVPEKDYDLVIAGTGFALEQKYITPNLAQVLEKAKKSIGIFGTHYRREIINQDVERVLRNLDYWFASTAEDILLYGKYAKQKMHLGCWIIQLAAMTEGYIEKRLEINDQIQNNVPIDTVIHKIQNYKTVLSHHPQPGLIALTSAEIFEHTETYKNEEVYCGEFRAIFNDIYGFYPPQDIPFNNNKQRVREYKKFVSSNIPILKQTIDKFLE